MTPYRGPHAYLHLNLTLLQSVVPGEPGFAEYVKEGMFEHLNRNGFERVLHYLLTVYDAKRTREKLLWPIIERRVDERRFRKEAVALVNEISKENHGMELPTFSPSFLTCPGGDRFVRFMWKLSILALKVVAERLGGDNILLLERITDPHGLHIMMNITTKNLQEIQSDVEAVGILLTDASLYAKKLCEDILELNDQCKKLYSELEELVKGISESIISKNEKDAILGSDKEVYKQVIKEWHLWNQGHLADQEKMLHELKKQSECIRSCYQSVKALVSSLELPVELQAPDLPEILQDRGSDLRVATLFTETSGAVSSFLNGCGGSSNLDAFENWRLNLTNITEQLKEVEASFARVNAELYQLISDTVAHVDEFVEKTGNYKSTPMVHLNTGYKMLQEATFATPPLVFVSQSDASHDMSISESPATEGLESILHTLREKTKQGMLQTSFRIPDEGRDGSFTPRFKTKFSVPYSSRTIRGETNPTALSTPIVPRSFNPSAYSTISKEPFEGNSSISFNKHQSVKSSLIYGGPSKTSEATPISLQLLSQEKQGKKFLKQNVIYPELVSDGRGQSSSLLKLAAETMSINSNESEWDELVNLDSVCSYNSVMKNGSEHCVTPSNTWKQQDLKTKQSICTESSRSNTRTHDVLENCLSEECGVLSFPAMQKIKTTMTSMGTSNGDKSRIILKQTKTSACRGDEIKFSSDVSHTDQVAMMEFGDEPSEFDSPPCSPDTTNPSFENTFRSPSLTENMTLCQSDDDSVSGTRDPSHSERVTLNSHSFINEEVTKPKDICSFDRSIKTIEFEKEVVQEKKEPISSTRRKSLLAIIEKYRQLTAARKEAEKTVLVEPSEDVPEELNISSDLDEKNMVFDTNLDFDL